MAVDVTCKGGGVAVAVDEEEMTTMEEVGKEEVRVEEGGVAVGVEEVEDSKESITRMEDKDVGMDKAGHNVKQEEIVTWGREMEEEERGVMDLRVGEQEEGSGVVGAKDGNGNRVKTAEKAPSGEG